MAQRAFLRFSIAQAAPSAVGGLYLPFFPLWLAHMGASPTQMSIAFAGAMFVRVFVSPVVGIVADSLGDRRKVAMACAALSCAFFIVLGLAAPYVGFPGIMALMLLATPLNSATGPIVEAVTARGAIDYRFDYARARLWGSLAFVATNYLGGVAIGITGDGAIVWMVTALVGANVIAFWPMPPLHRDVGGPPRSFGRALQRTASEARVLLRQPVFLLFLVAVGLIQASHTVFYSFGAIIFGRFGFSEGAIGFLWGLGTLAEVVLFAVAAIVMRHVGATGLIILGGGLGAVRWIGMAFDTGWTGAIALQLLHAASFGLVHLGTMKFLTHAVPARLAATGQSLFAVVVYGLMFGVATLAAGQVFAAVGPYAYWLMAVLALSGAVLTLALSRVWNGRNLFAQTTSMLPRMTP